MEEAGKGTGFEIQQTTWTSNKSPTPHRSPGTSPGSAWMSESMKTGNDRELQGRLHAYDQHLNMTLGDEEGTVTTIETDEETYEEIHKSAKGNILMLLVWGDGVVLVDLSLRVG